MRISNQITHDHLSMFIGGVFTRGVCSKNVGVLGFNEGVKISVRVEVWIRASWCLLIAHPHLLVRATIEQFPPSRATFRSVLANESQWLQPLLVLTVRWWPDTSKCGRAITLTHWDCITCFYKFSIYYINTKWLWTISKVFSMFNGM